MPPATMPGVGADDPEIPVRRVVRMSLFHERAETAGMREPAAQEAPRSPGRGQRRPLGSRTGTVKRRQPEGDGRTVAPDLASGEVPVDLAPHDERGLGQTLPGAREQVAHDRIVEERPGQEVGPGPDLDRPLESLDTHVALVIVHAPSSSETDSHA